MMLKIIELDRDQILKQIGYCRMPQKILKRLS